MGRLTLEAWRARLRTIHEYLPDRVFSGDYHLMKIRILQAALSHMKTNACRIKGKALVEFHHERYNHVMSEYGIPFYTCTASELYGRIPDGRHLQRYRCVPVNQYYSMLMEDTPGFVQTQPSVTPGSKHQDDRSKSREDASGTSTSCNSSSQYPAVTPRSRHQDDRSRSREEANGTSTSRNSSSQHPARSRRDELEVLSSTDKERIQELEMRILLVKQKRAPREYLNLRQEALEEAEANRMMDKSTPDYLEVVEPPWNDGRKEIEDLYDKMMVEDFKKRIADVRSSDDTRRSSDESGKATTAKGGPGGQGRR
jgi:hypothetical protein